MTSSFLSSVSSTGLSTPTEWVVFGVTVACMAAYSILIGRDRSILILLSLYISLAVITNAPLLSVLGRQFGITSQPSGQVLWFVGCFVLLFWLLARSALFERLAHGDAAWWESCLYGFLHLGLAISLSLFFLPPSTVVAWPTMVRELFLTDAARSFWLLAPLAAFVLLESNIGKWEDEEEI